MGKIAPALTGENFLQTENTYTSWITTHVRDKLLDTAWRSGAMGKNLQTGNEWTCTWGLTNYFITQVRENTRTKDWPEPDQFWALPCASDIYQRFVHRRYTFTPPGIYVPLVTPWPSGDNVNIDMGTVWYCDQEMRQEASILIGQKGTTEEGVFRVKHITNTGPLAGTYGAEPCHVLSTDTLLTLDSDSCNIFVPLFVNGQHITGAAGQTTNIHHNITNVDQHQTVHIKRAHKHAHTHIYGADNHTTYVAPARNVTNRVSLHNINTFEEFTNLQTINRIYRSVQTLLNFLHTDYTQIITRQNWGSIREKPDFDNLYASFQHVTDAVNAAVALKIEAEDVQTTFQDYTSTTSLLTKLQDYTLTADLPALIDTFIDDHQHDFAHSHADQHYLKNEVDILLGQRVGQTHYDSQIGTINNALAGKAESSHNHDDRYHTKTQISTLLGDRITLSGLMFTLSNYATTDSLANHVTTDTEKYFKKVDLFSNSIRIGWKENGDQNVLVPLLSTFQALVTRVEMLEQQVATLSDQNVTADSTLQTLTNTQTSIWAFTQLALQRIIVLEG